MWLSRTSRIGHRFAAISLISVTLGASVTSALLVTPSAGAASRVTTTTDPGLGLQQDFVRAVKAVRPSVVEIATSTSLGSGVVYDNKGDIVTNAHVVGTAKTFTVSFSDGKRLMGRLVGTYVPDDLAVIRVSPAKGLKAARFGDSSSLEVGDIVLAMGSPLGLSSSVTDGIVSFNGRAVNEGNGVVLPDLIQTSAAINPGNSGGALVSLSAQVIGIPTLAATSGSAAAPGLGFAIPSNTVKLIAPQLIAKGKVTTAGRAALGISGADAVSFAGAPVGVVVAAVESNGPAAKAGIVVGELITAINGTATTDFTALQTVLAELKPGARVTVAVTSADGKKRSVSVVLADLAQ
ncbi:MAG TPA: trypsin-like peptidase domain-containing protein [Acidimicrobiales bacterium]|nr:trypsin-like peptidase domain-containing protein [Acidimicrobiales bacterium]